MRTTALELPCDDYLARLYELCAERFHFGAWDTASERKLGTLESSDSKISDRSRAPAGRAPGVDHHPLVRGRHPALLPALPRAPSGGTERMRDLRTFEIQRQPDDLSCGPTCLHAVYRYFGDELSLERLIAEIPMLEEGGGTLEVMLGVHALRRGYRATLHTFNLRVFDPTWFTQRAAIAEKLEAQLAARKHPKIRLASRGYLDFLRLGGRIRFGDLTSSTLRAPLRRRLPILTGLSATYLHRSMRELPETSMDDDLRGDPVGHFVVLCGYDTERREVLVADPLEHPGQQASPYPVPIARVVGSIFLGVLTYDASCLVIEPRRRRESVQ